MEIHLKNKKLALTVVACLVMAAAMVASLAGCGDAGNKVTIGRAQWVYDVITINIVAEGIKDKGYDVDLKDIYDMGLMYAAVADGGVDFYPDAWLPTMQENFLDANKDSLVVGGDLYGSNVPLCWAIPGYTAEEYNITTLEDLKGKGNIFGGKIYGYEAGTGGSERSLEAIAAYDLGDEYEFVTGSVPSLLAELKANMQLNRPVMVVLWRPHPIFTQLDVRMLEDPKDIFGTNYIRYIAHNEFAENNPDIIHFLNNVVIPIADIEAMMLENEEQGTTEDELARNWYEEHKDTVATWWP